MYKTASVLSTLCALAAAIPNPTVAPSSGLDVNNPSGYVKHLMSCLPNKRLPGIGNAEFDLVNSSDPTSPPATISFPTKVAENPYPDGIPTQPDVCDGQNPSEDCFNAMDSGGSLWFDKDSECSDDQKGQLMTAVLGKSIQLCSPSPRHD